MNKIELFVPALALQHYDNPETCDLERRIRLAVMRWVLDKDFMSFVRVKDRSRPFVMIDKTKLIEEPLGYKVKCRVSS